jgi:hypothetical protein
VAEHSKRKAEFVFHMTDWISDLETLAALHKDPKMLYEKAACQLIFEFIVHVTPHLNAAGLLLLDEITDPVQCSQSGASK